MSQVDESNLEMEREGEVDFSKPIVRALLRDSRLSFAARGLYAFLWDMPRGWKPKIAHLVKMSPAGKDAVSRMLNELQEVGGIRIEHVKKESNGQFNGKRWVLVAADRWAVETPLSNNIAIKTDVSPEERETRQSGKPDHPKTQNIGKPAAKVHQGVEGSAIKTTTTMEAVEVVIEEIIESAVWQQKPHGFKKNEASFRVGVSNRLKRQGWKPSPIDISTLNAWRKAMIPKVATPPAQDDHLEIDPEAQRRWLDAHPKSKKFISDNGVQI